MEYLIGLAVAAGTCVFGRMAGLERERAFYATVAVVVATYYILFAAMASATQALVLEASVAAAFAALAVAGFKKNFWLVAAALAGHGIFDLVHHRFITNPGLPEWWPGFCMSFDVLAGVYVAVLMKRRSGSAAAQGVYSTAAPRGTNQTLSLEAPSRIWAGDSPR